MKNRLKLFVALLGALIFTARAHAQPAPDVWVGEPIGASTHPGGFSKDGELLKINGSGYQITGGDDAFYFVSQAAKGDTVLSAHFAKGLQYVDPRATAGVMIRASDAADAPFVYLGLVSQMGATFRVRSEAGGAVQPTDKPGKYTTAQEGQGAYLKVERKGRAVIGSISGDGKVWEEVGRANMSLPDEVLAGLAMTSSDPNQQYGFAWFDQINLTNATGVKREKKAGASLIDRPETAGEKTIGVDFTQNPPLERGLSFDRTAVVPGVHAADGKSTPAWAAKWPIEPTMGWTRSFRFKVTDPDFLNGKRPAVDVEIVFAQEAYGGVEVRADTARGSQVVASGWGASPDWKTIRVRLDDAYFGARPYPDAKPINTSGFDLRVDGVNSDLWLKSVAITAYDPNQNINWNRLLRIDDARGSAPGGLLAFERNAKNTVAFDVNNIASVGRPLRYTLQVAGYDDKVALQQKGEVKIGAGGKEKLPFTVDTTGWKYGPYDGKISFFLDDKSVDPILERPFRMGVVSDTDVPKARAGEFLYGLDPGHADDGRTGPETALAYLRLMGVDITRDRPTGLGDVDNALKTLAREGVQTGWMVDPPRDENPAKRAAALQKITREIEDLAREHGGAGPGKLHFWELGNEPDLPFFYPGTMPEYVDSMSAMYDAIKRGAGANPTLVFNGGLSFAGPDGDRRSREFIDIVPTDKVDLLAYHAHGPGIGAERNVAQKVEEQAAKAGAGKTKLGLIDTETGFAGTGRNGLVEQARTVVEKFAYAQSQDLASLYFFRLFMEGQDEAAYGLTDNAVEPKPSVMAYRNMVERLRHQKYVADLPFEKEAGTPGVHAFLFAEADDKGKPTGRNTLVAFTEGTARYDLSLRLGTAGTKVSNAQVFDLYGNAAPARVLPGNAAQLSVSPDPIYLSWAGEPTQIASVLPSALVVDAGGSLLAGATNTIRVTARNISAAPLPVQMIVEANSRLPITVTPQTRELTLPANGQAEIPLSVTLGAANAPLDLPRWWKVFADADSEKMSAADWGNVPSVLPGKNGESKGIYAAALGNRLSLDAIAGGFGERRNAVAYAVINAPRDLKLPVGAYADWWMAWYVNGKKVYDGLGDGGGLLANHLFELPLKAGRNVIAAQVQSGSQGWKLYYGGPAERMAAQTGKLTDAVRVTLKSGDNILAMQELPLRISAPLAKMPTIKPGDTLGDWMTLEPLQSLGGDEVTNFWVKEPDQSRWYKGDQDLSATVWLRDAGDTLQLFVAARDDKLVEAKSAAGLDKSDSLRVVMASDKGTLADARVGLVGGAAQIMGKAAGIAAKVTRDEKAMGGAATLYWLTIPKALIGAEPFRLSLTLSDNDSDFLKQEARLGEADKPGDGLRLLAK